MKLLQHILLTYINERSVFNEISYILLPDILEYYTKDKKYTHFKYDTYNMEFNYFIFPNDLTLINEDYCKQNCFSKKDDEESLKSKLNNKILIEKYILTNQHLYYMPFEAYKIHLKQDMAFDSFIEKIFNYNNQFSDKFYLNDGMMINNNELDIIISSLENYGISVLIKFIKDNFNIDIKIEWIKINIINRLKKDFDDEIYNNSVKLLIPNEEIIIEPNKFNIKLLNKNQSLFYKMELLKFYESLNINVDANLLI